MDDKLVDLENFWEWYEKEKKGQWTGFKDMQNATSIKPKMAAVYALYVERFIGTPLKLELVLMYIGKSTNLRSRVLEHWSNINRYCEHNFWYFRYIVPENRNHLDRLEREMIMEMKPERNILGKERVEK